MRCKVKNSVSETKSFGVLAQFSNSRVVWFVSMISIKTKKSPFVLVNMHFINVVSHRGYNKIVHVQCVICVLNQKYPLHVNYQICF